MGNQSLISAMEKVRKRDFEGNRELKETFNSLAFSHCDNLLITQFLDLIGATQLVGEGSIPQPLKDCFPMNGKLTFARSVTNGELWQKQIEEIWVSGFSSHLHSLYLTQPDHNAQSVVLAQSRDSISHEYVTLIQSMMACAVFMMRHQGGSSVEDFFESTHKHFAGGRQQFSFFSIVSTTMQGMLGGLVDKLAEEPERLKDEVEGMIISLSQIGPGSLFSYSTDSFVQDLQLKRLRQILVQVIQNERFSELRKRCVVLLLKIGIAMASAEDLLLAATYQYQYRVDLAQEIKYFCEQPEEQKDPLTLFEQTEQVEVGITKISRIQSRVAYGGFGDRQKQWDKMICDMKNYYTFAAERGLSRGEKAASNGEYKHAQTNQELKSLEGVTLLSHKQKIYLRHKGAPDVPFLEVNVSELVINEDQAKIRAPEGEKLRFKWTSAEDDPITNAQGHKRWMGIAPMCSDGRYIYTLVNYREDGEQSARKATVCEVYNLMDEVIVFKRQINLTTSDGSNWVGEENGNTSTGGYLNNGTLICNGVFLVWLCPNNYHMFDLSTGGMTSKNQFSSTKHLTMLDPQTYKILACDADVYSWLDIYELRGFKRVKLQEEETGDGKKKGKTIPEVPLILDDAKTTILENIVEEREPAIQLNLMPQLIGGLQEKISHKATKESYAAFRTQEKARLLDEEKKAGADGPHKKDLALVDSKHHLNQRAIILAHMANGARQKLFMVKDLQAMRLETDQMLRVFKAAWSVQISKSMFETMRTTVEVLIKDYKPAEADLMTMHALKSMLHIYLAHLACIRSLRISMKQIMAQDEIDKQQELLNELKKIDLLPGQTKNPGEDAKLNPRQCFQLHIFLLKEQTINEMEGLITTKTAEQTLEQLKDALESVSNRLHDESPELVRLLKRYDVNQFTELFNLDADCLKKAQRVLKISSEQIAHRLQLKFDKMLKDVGSIEDDFEGFGSEEAQALCNFHYQFMQEFVFTYGDQVYQKMLNAPKEGDSDETAQEKVKALETHSAKMVRLGDPFYFGLIDVSEAVRGMLTDMARMLFEADFKNWTEEQATLFFTKLEDILLGKASMLRGLQMFILSTNCYQVASTYLDEVSAIFFKALEGIKIFKSALDTASSLNPELNVPQKAAFEKQLMWVNRLVGYQQAKVAQWLINSKSDGLKQETLEHLQSLSVLQHGIKQNWIPALSPRCKKELEGSFIMMNDQHLKTLTQSLAAAETDDDKLLKMLSTTDEYEIIGIIAKNAHPDQNDEDNKDPEVDLIKKAFVTQVLFTGYLTQLRTSEEVLRNKVELLGSTDFHSMNAAEKLQVARRDESIVKLLSDLTPIYRMVTYTIKKWMATVKVKIEKEVEAKQTDVMKEELIKAKKMEDKSGTLDEEQMKALKVKCVPIISLERQKILYGAQNKADLMLKFAVERSEDEGHLIDAALFTKIELDYSDVISEWSSAPSSFEAKNQGTQKKHETQTEDKECITREVMSAILSECTAEEFKMFVEDNMIKGLRRLAGLELIRKLIAGAIQGDTISDGLQALQAGISNGEAKVVHYVNNIRGCGRAIQKQIKKQFFAIMELICQRLRVETDRQRLVHLVTCLIWAYQPTDMDELLKLKVFSVLQGEGILDKLHPMISCWGKESNFFSIEQKDLEEGAGASEYNLSARVRQTFVFIARLVLNYVFAGDEETGRNLSSIELKLKKLLLNQLNQSLFRQIQEHIEIMNMEDVRASMMRDQDYRFDNATGERADNANALNLREFSEVRREITLERYRKRQQKKAQVDAQLIGRFVRKTHRVQSVTESEAIFQRLLKDALESDPSAHIVQAVTTRDWRVVNLIAQSSEKELQVMDAEDMARMPLNHEIDPYEEQQVDLSAVIDNVQRQTTETGKLEAWIEGIKGHQGKKDEMHDHGFYSCVTVVRILDLIYQVINLSQKSVSKHNILKEIFQKQHLRLLVELSIKGTPNLQIVIQRIFQTLIKLNMPIESFDAAARQFEQQPIVLGVKSIISIKSSLFWRLQFNQIQTTRQAQFNSLYQVELGKVSVVEEIIRTFETYNYYYHGDLRETDLHKGLQARLLKVELLKESELATVFSLVRESKMSMVSTGKLCRDKDGDVFIVLGYRTESGSLPKLYIQQQPACQIVGLVVDSNPVQAIRTYLPQNVTPVPDLIVHATTGEQRKEIERKIAKKSSFFTNGDVMVKLIKSLTIKEVQTLRQTSERSVAAQLLHMYVLRGIDSMLTVYENEYYGIISSFNLLEDLLNFLATSASQELIKAEELLVSKTMMSSVATEMQMRASFLNRSVQYVKSVMVYVGGRLDGRSMFVQKVTDDPSQTQFEQFPIVHVVGKIHETLMCTSGNHALRESNYDEDTTNVCDQCKNSMQHEERNAQRKLGHLRCYDCNTDFCNECKPKLQINASMQQERGFQLTVYSQDIFRLPRTDAVLISSKDLKATKARALTAVRNANVVIIDNEQPLDKFLESLYFDQVLKDSYWKECTEVQFVIVTKDVFNLMKEYLRKPVTMKPRVNSCGQLLSAIFRFIPITHSKITNFKFISEFLKDPEIGVDDLMQGQCQRILEQLIDNETDDLKEREEAKHVMHEQITNLRQNGTTVVPVAAAPVEQSATVGASQNTNMMGTLSLREAPDFSEAFTEESGLMNEGGKDFFLPQPVVKNPGKTYHRLFDDVVFNRDLDGDGIRKLIWENLLKLNQSYSRTILLQMMANAKDAMDNETRNLINSTTMHIKICDLLHDMHMAVSHQSILFGDTTSMQAKRKQMKEVLYYFDKLEGTSFCNYFVKDLLKRSDLTIQQVKKDHYAELQSYNLKDLRKVSKMRNVLDPNNLLFFSKMLFKTKNFLVGKLRSQMAKVLFDLNLGFAILFKAEADAKICNQLLEGCCWALDQISANISQFHSHEKSVESLLQSKLLFPLFRQQKSGSSNDVSDKMRLLNEIGYKLSSIHQKIKQIFEHTPALEFCDDDSVDNLLRGYKVVQSGSRFGPFLMKVRMRELLQGKHAGIARHLGVTYQTDYRMFLTRFTKTLRASKDTIISVNACTTPHMLKLTNTTTEHFVVLNEASFRQGRQNSILIKQGQDAEVQFPVDINRVEMTGKFNFRNHTEDNVEMEDWGELASLSKYIITKVVARHHAALFLCTDEKLVGLGYRAQGTEKGDYLVRELPKPDNCVNIKKIDHGKFFRLVLTTSGELFFQGQAKKYLFGKETEINAHVGGFCEVKDFFPIEEGDKYVDMAGGKHFMIVLTESGKLYGAGWNFYKQIEHIRYNSQGSEEFPYQLKFDEAWHVRKVWAADTYNNIWVLAQKRDNPDVWQTFSAGSDYDMVGASDGEGAPRWRNPKLPENTWFVKIASQGHTAYAIDNHDHFWEWAQHIIQQGSGDSQAWESFTGDTRRSAAYRFKWFERNNLKPIDVRCGYNYAIVKCEDTRTKQIAMYGLSENLSDCNKLGKDFTQIIPNICLLKSTSGEITDFACARSASILVTRSKPMEFKSLIDDEPEYSGLVHFWKQGGQWVFKKEEDLTEEAYKNLPELVFATRHSINNFNLVASSALPDLEQMVQSNASNKPEPHDVVTTESGQKVTTDRLYLAKTIINGEPRQYRASRDEVKKGGLLAEWQPVIWFSLKSMLVPEDQFPVIDPSRVFARSSIQSQISFTIQRDDIRDEEIKKLGAIPEVEESLKKIVAVAQEHDMEILEATDRLLSQLGIKKGNIKEVKSVKIDVTQFQLHHASTLHANVNPSLLSQGASLLFKYNKAVRHVIDQCYISPAQPKKTIAMEIQRNKRLLLPSIRQQVVLKKINDHWAALGDPTSVVEITIDRKKAYDFFEAGIRNNPAFVTDSHIGQLLKQCVFQHPDLIFMANKNHNSFNTNYEYQQGDRDKYCSSQYQTNPYTYRSVERELQSDVLPLLERTPNGQMQKGLRRDCWVVSPYVSDIKHMKFLEFIGAFLARCLALDYLQFKVVFAPTFWKLAVLEREDWPDLQDFAREDENLAERLERMEAGAKKGAIWPKGEKWAHYEPDGTEVLLPRPPPEGKVVAASFDLFKRVLLNYLIGRTETQMQAVRKGFKTVMQGIDYMTRFLEWSDAEVMCMGERSHDFDRLQSNTKTNVTDQEYTERFWRVVKEFNSQDKSAFLNLVWGRSYLPDPPLGPMKEFKLTIDLTEGNTDETPPMADASKFELVIPRTYDTDEKMKDKLLAAIYSPSQLKLLRL